MEKERLKQALAPRGVLLRKGMAQLVADAVKREPPFNRVEFESCFEPYRKYLHKHPEKDDVATTAFIKLMEVSVAGDIVREQCWIEKWLEFKKVYEAECGIPPYIPPPTLKTSTLKKKDVSYIIGRVMKKFGYEKTKAPSRTSIRFSKQ